MIFRRVLFKSFPFFWFGFIFLACNTGQKKDADAEQDSSQQPWLLPFVKQDSMNPVMQPGDLSFMCPIHRMNVKWENKNVYNPAVAVRNDTLFMLYRAQDSAGCSRIGLATSTDGIHFERHKSPVLYPDNDEY